MVWARDGMGLNQRVGGGQGKEGRGGEERGGERGYLRRRQGANVALTGPCAMGGERKEAENARRMDEKWAENGRRGKG